MAPDRIDRHGTTRLPTPVVQGPSETPIGPVDGSLLAASGYREALPGSRSLAHTTPIGIWAFGGHGTDRGTDR